MDNQGILFDLPENKQKSVLTCRTCVHRYKHEYGKMYYCSKRKQKGTAYGDKKVKAGDPACSMYEKE